MRSGIRSEIRLALLLAVLASGCASSFESAVPPAEPGTPRPDGLSFVGRAGLEILLQGGRLAGLQNGYVAVFARDGHLVHGTAVGHADAESKEPMTLDTRFRIASMTKPVTAAAAMILIEDGALRLDDRVADYIPAAGRVRVATSTEAGPDGAVPTEPLARPLLVEDLLTFSAGIGSEDDPSDLGRLWAANDIYAQQGSLEERVDRILSAPLYEQPGVRWRYGWSADVLARVVEVAAGKPFDEFLSERIFEPLGMSDTSFLPPPHERGRVATMYRRAEDGGLERVATPASDAPDWTPGGSGLVSTASDYLRFALMLGNGGSFDGVRVLREDSVRAMTTPHVRSGVLEEEGMADGLGWGYGLAIVTDADATPMLDHDGDFWWSGYYGTTFFVSPQTGMAGTVLTQYQPRDRSDVAWPVFLAQAAGVIGR